jgi:hypothetical protein
VQHLVDGRVQEARDVVGELVVVPGREPLLLDLLKLRLDLLDHLGRVGARRLLEDDGRARPAVHVRVDVEELRPEFDAAALLLVLGLAAVPAGVGRGRRLLLVARGPPRWRRVLGGDADVPEPQDLAVGVGPQDDVLVLLGLVEPPDVGEHVLLRLRLDPRGLAEPAGRADHALLGHRLHDVGGGDLVGPHPLRVEPDAHRVGPVAEVPRQAHPLDPLQLGHDVGVGEVEQVLLVGGRVLAVNVHVHQHARHHLADEDALAHDQRREPAQHDVDPVLHVHHVDVRVGPRLEVDADRRLPGAGGVGHHVPHVLDAVDRLLERDEDRIDQHVGAGPGVGDRDLHGRRRDVGELLDGQRLDPEHAQKQEEDGNDDRQRRPVEDFREHVSEVIS